LITRWGVNFRGGSIGKPFFIYLFFILTPSCHSPAGKSQITAAKGDWEFIRLSKQYSATPTQIAYAKRFSGAGVQTSYVRPPLQYQAQQRLK